MKHLGNESGFSFLEIVIALGIIMILVSALVPVVSTQLDNAKIARTKDDCQLIAAAICQFNADTGEWPIWRNGTQCTHGKDYYRYLVSGDGEMPGNINPGSFATSNGYDTIDNQMVYNTPSRIGTGNGYPYPDEADDTSSPWRGPYLHGPNGGNNSPRGTVSTVRAAVSKDPWGNNYIVNVWALAPVYNDTKDEMQNHYVAVVLSAGPNEKVDTYITSTTKMRLREFKVGLDDIICVIR